MSTTPHGTAQSSYVDIPVVESPSPLIISSTTPPPVVDTPIKSLTPNNRSLSFLQSGSVDRSQLHVPLSRGQFPVFPSEVTSFSTTSNRCRWTRSCTMMSRQCVPGRNQHVTNSWLLPSVMSPSHGRTWLT